MNDLEKCNRTCIVCKIKSNKTKFVRFVRLKECITLDLKMILAGRGAYICKTRKCFLQSIAKKRLCYALKVNINNINWDKLLFDVNSVSNMN